MQNDSGGYLRYEFQIVGPDGDTLLNQPELGRRHDQHIEQLVDKAALPVAVAYCITIVVIAAFILLYISIRASVRGREDDNRRMIEIAKIEFADASDDPDARHDNREG